VRLVRGQGWNLALRVLCVAPLLLVGAGATAWFLTGPLYDMPVAAALLAMTGAVCAWRSILQLRLVWWYPGFVLLAAACFVLIAAEGFDLDRLPEDPVPDLARWVAMALITAAVGGFALAWRASRIARLRVPGTIEQDIMVVYRRTRRHG
jgi:hypothetical protein